MYNIYFILLFYDMQVYRTVPIKFHSSISSSNSRLICHLLSQTFRTTDYNPTTETDNFSPEQQPGTRNVVPKWHAAPSHTKKRSEQNCKLNYPYFFVFLSIPPALVIVTWRVDLPGICLCPSVSQQQTKQQQPETTACRGSCRQQWKSTWRYLVTLLGMRGLFGKVECKSVFRTRKFWQNVMNSPAIWNKWNS